MGKTWRLGRPPDPAPESVFPVGFSRRSDSISRRPATRTLQGSDLYRINCEGCHGETGRGAPPEIGSLIEPIRATSAILVEERIKKIGMGLSHREIVEMANQSKSALLARLHKGGEDMPSFHYLARAEIRSLVAYLKQLAGVPGAQNQQIAIPESHARVGELIVKSTCHICHAATGTDASPAELLAGLIPPLSALPARVDQAALVRKVTRGAPVIMGATPSPYRGRMPVFAYLTEDEANDVYEYLTHYSPAESVSPPDPTDPPTVAGGSGGISAQPELAQVPRDRTASVVLPVSLGSMVVALLALGCWITVREFKRLSIASQARMASRDMTTASREVLRVPGETVVEFPSQPVESAECKTTDWVQERKTS